MVHKNIQSGQWLFTCSMIPQQFCKYIIRNPLNYNLSDLNKTQLSDWVYDQFYTMDGTSHSQIHCGCILISEEYAKWFINGKRWEIFEKYKDYSHSFKLYKNELESLAKRDSIQFEGF